MFKPELNIMFEVWFSQTTEPEPEWRLRFGVRVNPNMGFQTKHFMTFISKLGVSYLVLSSTGQQHSAIEKVL